MRLKGMQWIFIGIVLSIVCCSSNYPLLSDTAVSEVNALKDSCRKKGLESPEVLKADSLAALAAVSKQEGKDNDAYWMAQLAAVYYELALSKYELGTTEKRVRELRKSLTAVKGQLRTYKQVLRELESIKKP